jgi:thymidine kinase
MNGSKSAQLLMAAFNYEERGMEVLIVKPKLDTRDGEYVKSRALDVKRKADIIWKKEELGTVKEYIYVRKLMNMKPPAVVLVDEAQFLTREQVDELSDIVDELDIPVMAYGLRTDFNGNAFEGSQRLFEMADKFQHFKTVCPCCGKNAIVNMRTDADGNPIFNGSQIDPGNHYLPVCRKYYKQLKSKAMLPV